MHLYPVSVADHLPSVFSLAFLCKNGAVRTALCGFHAARGDWSVYGVRLVSMVKKTEGWQNAMQTASYVLSEELDDTGELQTVLAHNEQEYLREQKEHYMQQQELQDYISRWSHEIKLPLAALRMMNERNTDAALQKDMQKQLEKMERQLHMMLCTAKAWMPAGDRSIMKIELKKPFKAL